MTELPDDLPGDLATLWFLVRRVGTLMDRAGEALFRDELGITLAQFLVLSVVDAHPGPLSQQTVAQRVGLTKGTVSRQIEQAVTAGLISVEVSAHSRREHEVSLTRRGTDLVRRGDALLEERQKRGLTDLDPADVAATVRVLKILDKNLGTGTS